MKVEMDNVDQVVDGEITENGRIFGLTKFKNRKAKVLVMEE